MEKRLIKRSLGAIVVLATAVNGLFAQSTDPQPGELPVNAIAASDSTVVAVDEDIMIIPPLFEYIVAPEDLPDLQSRTDYLMDNFWNPFDFKNTKFVDQIALNHAFGVYCQAMTFASEKKVEQSVKKLIKNIKGNPGLSLQFAKAAEENLFGPRAEIWADGVYMEFLQNLVDNKKIDNSKKKRYQQQLDLLRRTAIGAPFPEIELLSENGTLTKFQPEKNFRLIEFTLPNCEDCRYSNVKMDISGVVNDLIEDGNLDVMLVMTGYPVSRKDYPEKWIALSSDNAADILDIRVFPCFYIVDREGKIRGKNLNVDTAIGLLETLAGEKNNR